MTQSVSPNSQRAHSIRRRKKGTTLRSSAKADLSSYVMPAGVLVAALAIATVGASTFNILPLLTSGAAHTLGFSDRQIGLMSVAITIGSAAGALVAGMWVRSVPWPRAALIALSGMLAVNVIAMFAHLYWTFIILQGAAGFFSNSVYCLALTILSDRHESARTFGVLMATQVASQIATLLAGTQLLRLAGVNGLLALLASLGGCGMFIALLLPSHGRKVTRNQESAAVLTPATVVGLVGRFTFCMNIGAYWTYVELMGQARGLSPGVVADCLAIGISAGLLGGVLASVQGDRFGKLRPLAVATLLTIGAALLLNSPPGRTAFLMSGVLYCFAWNYALAYQLAIVNTVDVTGRAMAIAQAFAFLGIAGGAGLTAFFVKPGDYHAVEWLIAIGASVGAALYAASFAIHRHVPAHGAGSNG